jgi:hypothetical protein
MKYGLVDRDARRLQGEDGRAILMEARLGGQRPDREAGGSWLCTVVALILGKGVGVNLSGLSRGCSWHRDISGSARPRRVGRG